MHSLGPPSPKQFGRHDRIVKNGRSHFIFYRGVLGFGIPSCAGFLFLEWRDFVHSGWIKPSTGQVIFAVISNLALWLASGYVWGIVMWKWFTSRSAKK